MNEKRFAGWVVAIVLLTLTFAGVRHHPASPSQAYDFRLSQLERQVDQLRLRVDQLEQMLNLQRAEARRPELSLDYSRLTALEKQQELTAGRLVLMEKAWQSAEAALEQMMKERAAEAEKPAKTHPDETRPPEGSTGRVKERPL
ncbi:MAG: hypothetical protein HY650_12650 [Acidobacteria bacterium]|nr:hypothetical protein [Acidobacteriota bacterium]